MAMNKSTGSTAKQNAFNLEITLYGVSKTNAKQIQSFLQNEANVLGRSIREDAVRMIGPKAKRSAPRRKTVVKA